MNTPKHELVLQLLLLILVLLISTITSVKENGFLVPIAHVSIRNDLWPDLNLTAHCKSKNDDLGIQVVPFGANFSFHFRPSFWGTTLFFCDMSWNDGPRKHFDIYSSPRDHDKCECYHYYWSITTDKGPCMFNVKTNKYEFCYPWQS